MKPCAKLILVCAGMTAAIGKNADGKNNGKHQIWQIAQRHNAAGRFAIQKRFHQQRQKRLQRRGAKHTNNHRRKRQTIIAQTTKISAGKLPSVGGRCIRHFIRRRFCLCFVVCVCHYKIGAVCFVAKGGGGCWQKRFLFLAKRVVVLVKSGCGGGKKNWWALPGLNRRPPPCEGGALPLS